MTSDLIKLSPIVEAQLKSLREFAEAPANWVRFEVGAVVVGSRVVGVSTAPGMDPRYRRKLPAVTGEEWVLQYSVDVLPPAPPRDRALWTRHLSLLARGKLLPLRAAEHVAFDLLEWPRVPQSEYAMQGHSPVGAIHLTIVDPDIIAKKATSN